jgi:hypothetical protein
MAQKPIKPWEPKLYYNSDGSGSAASYTEIEEAQDVNCAAPRDQNEATTRGAGQFKVYEPGHVDLELTFTMIATRDDSSGAVGTVLAALIAGHSANTVFGWAVKDGAIGTTGSAGWEFDGSIVDMTRNENLGDGSITYEFTVKPAYGGATPTWRTTA